MQTGSSTRHAVTPDTWVSLLRDRAESTPGREAFTFLVDGESQQIRWDYRTLDARARAIAVRLAEACRAGDRAVLLYPPGAEFVAAFLGCLYAGVIAVPAYPPRSAEHERALPRLRGILADAQPSAVLTATAKLLDTVRECVNAAGGNPQACIDTESLPDTLGDAWRGPSDITADTVAFLQYTSGSTAVPKGVVLTHGNLLHNSATIRDAFGHTENSRGVIWLPPYHDMGLIGGILQPIFAGFPVTLMPPAAMLQKPLRWLKAVSDWRATTSGGPDFAYDLCLRSIKPADRETLDLSHWDLAFTGAEPVRKATLDRFAEAFAPCGFRREAFYPCYGLAEATLLVTGGGKLGGIHSRHVDADALRENRVVAASAPSAEARTPDESAAGESSMRELVGCGIGRGGTEVRIVNPQSRIACAAAAVGEIWVRGPGVARGYWQRSGETAETFDATIDGADARPWLRTGDLGFVADAGGLYVTGRIKDLVIIRGRNHYPHDLEHAAGSCHPALRVGGGAAFSVEPDGQPERLVVMHEIERTQRDTDPNAVFGAVREAIARGHELQTHAIVLLKPGRLPRTSSGKVRRHACREAFVSGTDLGELARWVASAAAETAADESANDSESLAASERPDASAADLERWLQGKLAAALELSASEIDPAEPFARYGLDSASAVALAGEIASEMSLDLEATLFWDYPSVRALAGFLASPRGPENLAGIQAA